MPVAAAALLDALVVIIFATVGRRNHGEGDALTGILTTAWPFLAAAAIGWVIVSFTRGVASGRSLASGSIVWVSTVAFGMILRHVAGRGVAVSFIIVALVFIGACMLGWRLVASIVTRRARREA